ncbi:hypothetical protein J5N97_028312 [Dioscorea zingiberensis]|uniref:CCHC-type domain-containing protein n=1 Tax=Dioscorea zingiberensis TaxID=325984 RepID=A0A9D5BYZ5_9LILI|nr:hypothetical protein J5N97_028312 [Dioscorea zingiberensis]
MLWKIEHSKHTPLLGSATTEKTAVTTAETATTMAKAWRRRHTQGEPRRNTQALTRTPAQPAQRDHDHRRTEGRMSPRREGVTYVNALTGDQHQRTHSAPRAPSPSHSDERGWEKVTRKRRKDSNPAHRPRRSPDLHGSHQRSPPTIQTTSGRIEVCRQCLQQGHKAAECRRAPTCRACGEVGHRRAECRRGRMEPRYKAPTKDQKILASSPGAGEAEATQNPPPKTHEPTPLTPPPEQKKTEDEDDDEVHFISLALDSEMLQDKEELKSHTLITIKKIREGFVDHRRLAAVLAEIEDEAWNWEMEEYSDRTFLVACPSPSKAPQMEAHREVELPEFTYCCSPWTPDHWLPGKAEGEARWVTIERLPIFCRSRETVSRMLKPIGELIHIDSNCGRRSEIFRAALRVSRG